MDLPERSAWAIHKALRQVLHYAVRAKLLDENVACSVPNLRTITGLNNSDEYAIVVARALVRGIVESCAYGEIPPGAVLRP